VAPRCNRTIENRFEEQISSTLGSCPLDGVATDNIIIPNVDFRDLPDEHDILVLLAGTCRGWGGRRAAKPGPAPDSS
jgi:hypothetical protein